MLAMAPLLPGGLLGGFEDIVGGVGGSEEGGWTSSTVSGGLRAAVETGELARLLIPAVHLIARMYRQKAAENACRKCSSEVEILYTYDFGTEILYRYDPGQPN